MTALMLNRIRVNTKTTFIALIAFVTVLILVAYLRSFDLGSVRRQKTDRNERLTFFAIGDFGGRGSEPYSSRTQRQVADRMAEQAKLHNVRVVLALGDNFYPHGVKHVDDPRFQATFEDVYTAAALKRAQWLMVAGNHDYEQNVTAQIAYTKKSHRWYFPYFYYTKVYRIPGTSKTVQIVMTDSKILCRKTPKTAKARRKFTSKSEHRHWVQKTLRDSKADYLVVAGHNPILSGGINGKSKCLESFLKPLLQKYSVTLYISGHDHNFQHIKENEVNYIVTGNSNYYDTGRTDRRTALKHSLKTFYGKTGGFTMLSARTSSLKVTHINTDGDAVYTTDIPKRTPHY